MEKLNRDDIEVLLTSLEYSLAENQKSKNATPESRVTQTKRIDALKIKLQALKKSL